MTCPLTPLTDRSSPLPLLNWANPHELWELMCNKDEISAQERDEDLFSKHPSLQPRMRAILLDWLIEVSYIESAILMC
jgi:cyclin E